MITIKKHDTGAAVEDIQQRLCTLGYLDEARLSGVYDDCCEAAVLAFAKDANIESDGSVTDELWSALVDAGFNLADRTLYLRMPYFHGNDVFELQQALGALGFSCGNDDGIFGAYTETAVRKFQMNLGLFSDGIVGAQTYEALKSLHHSWEDRASIAQSSYFGFARAADVLESQALCLFGTCEFTRSVALRMSNLAIATTPGSKVISADLLSVPPTEDMLLIHIVLPGQKTLAGTPRVSYEDEAGLALRIKAALSSLQTHPGRMAVELPSEMWQDAKAQRSAQHFAITLLDALCFALSDYSH